MKFHFVAFFIAIAVVFSLAGYDLGKKVADRWYVQHPLVHEHWNWYTQNPPVYEQQHSECPSPMVGTDFLCGPVDGRGAYMSINGGPYYRVEPGFIAAITEKEGCKR